ncbi:MAG: FAD-dependent oxidoreductase [Firmicutes bacterium]|nr:FAD-dependent oxidoreductase [Bacillota bacterium]
MHEISNGKTDCNSIFDLTIIGAGPAGMTACVYAARKKLKTALISELIGGQMTWTWDIENYMGYQFITGPELSAKFEQQITQFPITRAFEKVSRIERIDKHFRCITDTGNIYDSRAVIIATGKQSRELGVPGEKEFRGKGVSYCAICDAPLYRGVPVAVIGCGNSGIEAAESAAKYSSEVHVVCPVPWHADPILTEKVKQLPSVKEHTGFMVEQINGDQYVENIVIKNNSQDKEVNLDVKGIFIEIGLTPNTGFCKGFVELNNWGEIIINNRNETSIPGVFAAGDATDVPEKQIIIAAGEGAKATLSAYRYLLNSNDI